MSTVKSVGAWLYQPKQVFRFSNLDGNFWSDREVREDKRKEKAIGINLRSILAMKITSYDKQFFMEIK